MTEFRTAVFFPKHLNTSPEMWLRFSKRFSQKSTHLLANKTALNVVPSLLKTNFLHQNNSLRSAILCLCLSDHQINSDVINSNLCFSLTGQCYVFTYIYD